MRLTTLIKAYKIALYNINNIIDQLGSAFICKVILPADDDIIRFVFSNDDMMSPGSLATQIGFSIAQVERLQGGLNGIKVDRKLLNSRKEFNDPGKFLNILNNVYVNVKEAVDNVESVIVTEVELDFFKNMVIFHLSLNGTVYKTYANDNLVLIGF